MELNPGTAFGRYTIESELGRGGMGRVMLATDTVLHRQVALKILLPAMAEKEEVVLRFFREARLAAQLNHPNVAHVYDLGEALGMSFIAMEYVSGKPLTAYVGNEHTPADQKLRWLVDVARGLSAAHARNLLHRDMKPSNVMVSREGVAKVVDFGLAKRELPSAEVKATFQTAQGFLIGTPAYMAPEQLDADNPIDARADQFGWALTAYALMLGKNLRKEDPLLFGPIPLLCDRVPGVSRRASEIILRALSNDREMRFPTMDALIAELVPAIATRPSNPPSPRATAPFISQAPVSFPVPSSTPTRLVSASPPSRTFCPDCGLSLAMPSSRCKNAHAEAFPKPPGIDDSEV